MSFIQSGYFLPSISELESGVKLAGSSSLFKGKTKEVADENFLHKLRQKVSFEKSKTLTMWQESVFESLEGKVEAIRGVLFEEEHFKTREISVHKDVEEMGVFEDRVFFNEPFSKRSSDRSRSQVISAEESNPPQFPEVIIKEEVFSEVDFWSQDVGLLNDVELLSNKAFLSDVALLSEYWSKLNPPIISSEKVNPEKKQDLVTAFFASKMQKPPTSDASHRNYTGLAGSHHLINSLNTHPELLNKKAQKDVYQVIDNVTVIFFYTNRLEVYSSDRVKKTNRPINADIYKALIIPKRAGSIFLRSRKIEGQVTYWSEKDGKYEGRLNDQFLAVGEGKRYFPNKPDCLRYEGVFLKGHFVKGKEYDETGRLLYDGSFHSQPQDCKEKKSFRMYVEKWPQPFRHGEGVLYNYDTNGIYDVKYNMGTLKEWVFKSPIL